MEYRKINEGYGYALVLRKGEPVKEKLVEFARTEKIGSAFFTGIGAVDKVRLGYYNPIDKNYPFTEYENIYELASLQGNITMYEGEHTVHMHAVIRDSRGRIMAGHMDDANVAVTLEMFIHLMDGASINKKFDPETGLPLWNFDK